MLRKPQKTLQRIIPEEVTKELEKLRNKVISTNSQNLNTVKFKVHFEEVAKGFNEIIKDLREIEDEEINTKFKAAVKKLISDIDKKLQGSKDNLKRGDI